MQWRYPREFRIVGREVGTETLRLLAELGEPRPQGAQEDPQGASGGSISTDAVPLIATGLWRLRNRMIDPETGRPHEQYRKAFRHLEAVWDALQAAGVEIRDHTGEVMPRGGALRLNILTLQPTPGVTRERVLETVTPSVYVGTECVQVGEVIVATPLEPPENASVQEVGAE